MNRIYQGRVASVQVPKPNTKNEWEALPEGTAALWTHHQLFQDAVNYYIVALAALGESPESKLTRLRELLAQVWDGFEKYGQRRDGMGASLQRSWQLDAPPSLDEAVERFRAPLRADGVSLSTTEKAAEYLLFMLGGDAAIQQGGREFLPMFCDPAFAGTFKLSGTRRGRADDERRLQRELHRELSDDEITALAASVTLGSVVNLQTNAEPDAGAAVVARLNEAQQTFASDISEEVMAQWLAGLSPDFVLPKRRGGNINVRRADACTLFLAFPNPTTKRLFQGTFSPPKDKTGADGTAGDETERFLDAGDDPIQRARGTRGWVFPGFTALPLWANAGPHLAWKEFDIAAFKEALKVYNQFQQNLEKREAKLAGLAAKLLVMDGEAAIAAYAEAPALRSRLERVWTACDGKPKAPPSESGEEVSLSRFADDPRIARLRRIINDDLAEEYRLTDGRRTPYGLRRRTMKGWSDVKRRWQQKAKAGTPYSDAKCGELQAELNAMRTGEKRERIGSHRLFEALLADEEAWRIWREPDAALQDMIAREGWAEDPLEAFRDYCETREAFEEISSRPLRFTPADARFSRRLFMFTDVCSFGKARGEFRHDPQALAVTVPVALRGANGCFAVRTCRLAYSAPRLLRDRIRAEDGAYTQDWTQPMMRALFGPKEEFANPQSLADAAVQLMPDMDSSGSKRVLLNFPLSLDEAPLRAKLGKAALWEKQFVTWKKGAQFPFLRWESDFDGKEPHRWWQRVSDFRVLAADLGTRHAASVALIDCRPASAPRSRFIGRAGEVDWHGRYVAGAVLRLPGEDAVVLRPESPIDRDGRGKAFREEPFGARGRNTTPPEVDETLRMLAALEQTHLLGEGADAATLAERFSFPELNDKLLVAIRRTQAWIAACISWHWKISQPESEDQRTAALAQLREQEKRSQWRDLATPANGPEYSGLRDALQAEIVEQRRRVEEHLLRLTNRIAPLRSARWEWVSHPDKADCRLLRTVARTEVQSSEKPKIRGQRGLSMARIEQLSELRRRWQSLNQSLRRQIGAKPPTAAELRNEPIPDPCPALLVKLEHIREQRVNQIAHLILAQALGVRLRSPVLPAARRAATDTHGEYESFRPPVDVIVLEDLSRYLSDQGRAKSENSRLMKWCHRAASQKLKMLAEPFGIPVLETPAAYSSRFCSLTGAAGFRATEVGIGDRHDLRWRTLLREASERRAEKLPPSEQAAAAETLFDQLDQLTREGYRGVTLLAPQPGGPVFVTACAVPHPDGHRELAPMHADIGAAANLAFRAVAHPSCVHIHHRLRTERKKGKGADTFVAREPRRFGKEKIEIVLRNGDSLPKERNPNLFFDSSTIAPFGRAKLGQDKDADYPYASGQALWKAVNDRDAQWRRCAEINAARIAAWRNKAKRDTADAPNRTSAPPDDIPM